VAFLQCSFCGQPFNGAGTGKVCPTCRKMLDEQFITIRGYLYKNPEMTNMITVSEELGIPEKVINFLIDEGRLEVGGQMAAKSRCRVCGSPCVGVLCDKCRGLFVEQTKDLAAKKNEAEKKKDQDQSNMRGIKFHINKKP